MIIPHPALDANITKENIVLIADRNGYDRYLPITFIKHLAYAFSFYKMNKSPLGCIQNHTEYTKEFSRLLNMIHFDEVRSHNPIEFAIKVLLLMHRRFDLRKLEFAALSMTSFKIAEVECFQNYSFDLELLSDEQLLVLNINKEELHTIELSDEILRLLKFYNDLSILDTTVETEYRVVKEQIKSFSDFYKGRRYKLALPTFAADLGMKRLQITKVDDVEIFSSEVILAVDFSMSMAEMPLAKTLIRSVFLYYIGQLEKNERLTVVLVSLIGKVRATQRISNAEELKILFKTLPVFTLPSTVSKNIFSDLNDLYPGKSVILLSDGKFILKELIVPKYKLYSIVLTQNDILKQMSLLSGGQFTILR